MDLLLQNADKRSFCVTLDLSETIATANSFCQSY